MRSLQSFLHYFNRYILTPHNYISSATIASTFLRLLRHALSSHIYSMLHLCTQEFNEYVKDLLDHVQMMPTVDITCVTIRLGLSLKSNSPLSVYKAINPETGEVMVESVCVPKSTWSRAIPVTLSKFATNLKALFPRGDLLDKILDTTNPIVWKSKDSIVILRDNNNNGEIMSHCCI
jgi:hypothetical protein